MADGTVIIETDLDGSGLEKGLSKLGSTATKGLGVATKAVTAVGAALIGAGGAAVKVGMGFESSMSQVAATMGITVDEIANGSEAFELLENAAKEAGATTQFSASQSAEALNYLALAGYDAGEAASALPTVLNLAAAGGLDLAYASDLVTDSMSALGLEMTDLDGFVDKLAKTSQKSNTSVAQLGEAILTVGGTAKVLAGGTTELNTALGILADNGVKGAEGGTALRNIILSLTAPTDTAARKMKELGLEVLDAEGNMRPLTDIFNDLNGTLSDMTQGEQTQVLNELFNKTDLKSVNALLANSGERFDELSGYIDDASGAATNMAETMNDNLKGKITTLGSALEGLGIEIYDSLKVGLQDAVEGAIDSVGRLSEAFKNNGFDGLINGAGLVLSDFLVKIAEYAPQVVNAAIQLIQSFITAIQSNLPTIVQSAIQIGQSVITGLLETLPQVLQMGIDIIVELANGLSQTLPELIPVAIDAILTLVDTLLDNIDSVIDAGIELIIALADGLIESLPNLIDKVPIIIGKLLEAIASNLPKLIEAGIELVVKLAEGVVNAIPQLVSKIPGLINAVLGAIATFLGNFFESGSRISQRIGEGISSMTGALGSIGISLIQSLIGSVTGAISGFFNIGKNIVQGVWNGITSMGSWITSNVKNFFNGIVSGAKKALGIHSPSRVFRDEVGKFMAEGVGVGFEQESDSVKRDIELSLLDMTNKMKATVEYEQSNFTPSAVYADNTSRKNEDKTNNTIMNGPQTIEVPVIVDGREIARATAPYQEEFDKWKEGR